MQAKIRTFRAVLATWLIVSLSACGSADIASSDGWLAADAPFATQRFMDAKHAAAPDTAAQSDDALRGLAAGETALATDLYRVIGAKSGNVVFSPHAIAMALGMVSMGSQGNTAEQVRAVLHWGGDAPDRPAQLAAWRQALSDSASHPATLSAANAVWGVPDLTPTAAFAANLREGFDTTWHSLDIASAPTAARERVNAWVDAQTQGLIEHLLAPGQLDPSSRMIVTSALAVTAPWQKPFAVRSTAPGDFFREDGRKSVVPMMHAKVRAGFVETKAFQVVDLPYQGGSLHFTVLVPAGKNTLTQAASAQSITDALQGLQTRMVQLTLPRFSISASYSLREALQALGMVDAFCADNADFTPIEGSQGLALQDVIHQAVIEVDEAGTRAAAATGATMIPTAIEANAVTLAVDRPFMFLIRDTGSQSLLFLGHVEHP